MVTNKHRELARELARELIGRREATLNYDTLTDAIAAALEAMERETEERVKLETAQRCAELAEEYGLPEWVANKIPRRVWCWVSK